MYHLCTTLWKALVEASPHPNTFLSSFCNQSTTTEGKNSQLGEEQDRVGATQLHIKGYSEWATLLERMELKCSSKAAPNTSAWGRRAVKCEKVGGAGAPSVLVKSDRTEEPDLVVRQWPVTLQAHIYFLFYKIKTTNSCLGDLISKECDRKSP